jgi:hypothetical protein
MVEIGSEAPINNLSRVRFGEPRAVYAWPMQSSKPIPVRPVYPTDPRPDPSRALIRSATAMVMREIRGPTHGSAEQILEKMWPRDSHALAVLRASTSPATMTTTGWAAELVPKVTTDFVSGLQLRSAFAALAARGLQLSLEGIGTILIPHAVSNAALGFVAEGAPAPVLQRTLANATLGPAKKIAGIAVLTNELAEHSIPNAEAVVGVLLQEASALALDAAAFSNAAATSSTPAGLLNGVSALTATTGGGFAALLGDIKQLVAAVVTGGAGNNLVFIVNANQLVSLKLFAPPGFDYPVIPSPALAAGTVVCLDASAFASAFTDVPRIETGREVTLHFEDTTPLQIGTPGTPATVAAPARDMFQSDSFGIRLILSGSWVMRQPAAVAWVSGATW